MGHIHHPVRSALLEKQGPTSLPSASLENFFIVTRISLVEFTVCLLLHITTIGSIKNDYCLLPLLLSTFSHFFFKKIDRHGCILQCRWYCLPLPGSWLSILQYTCDNISSVCVMQGPILLHLLMDGGGCHIVSMNLIWQESGTLV